MLLISITGIDTIRALDDWTRLDRKHNFVLYTKLSSRYMHKYLAMQRPKCQNMQQDAHWSNQSEIPCIQSITLSITAYVQEKVNTASVEQVFF